MTETVVEVLTWTGTKFAALRGTDLTTLWTTDDLGVPGVAWRCTSYHVQRARGDTVLVGYDILLTVRSTARPETPVVGVTNPTEPATVVTKGYIVDGRDGSLLWESSSGAGTSPRRRP